MTRLTRPHSETEAELLKDPEYVKALSLELDDTVKELERLRTENEELSHNLKLCRRIIMDVYEGMECLERCDSYAHEDDCPDVNPLAAFAKLRAEIAELKSAIHYPEHWDTVAYPTLLDALKEIGCNECEEAQ